MARSAEDSGASDPPRRDAGPAGWRVGRKVYEHRLLPTLLRLSAQSHARRALSLFVADDKNDQLLAAISVGCAVEQLTKGLIAYTEPALLAARGADAASLRDTLLHLTGHGHLASSPPTDIRTVSGPEALVLAQHIHRAVVLRLKSDQVVWKVRNAAAHMGLVDAAQLQAAVLWTVRYVDSVLPAWHSALTPDHFWGAEHAALAAQLMDEAVSETRRIVAAKVAAAQRALDELLGRLDTRTRVIVLASLSGRPTRRSDTRHNEPAACPVCRQQGWLLCTVARGPLEWDEAGQPSVAVTAYPTDFECPVCGLDLEGEELDEFDFPTEIEREPDYDPSKLADLAMGIDDEDSLSEQ